MTKVYVVAALVLVTLGVLAAVTVVSLRRRLRVVTVRGASMTPTLQDGQRVLVRTRAEARRDDLAVFRTPDPSFSDGSEWLVKRIVAVAGDTVPPDMRGAVPDEVVPAGAVVVRGDFAGSTSSKEFGLVPTNSILGVVVRPLVSSARAVPDNPGAA